jgi:hypothetical protein
MPVISGTQETDVGGSQSQASLGKSMRPYVKNKLTAKMFGSNGSVLFKQAGGPEFNL